MLSSIWEIGLTVIKLVLKALRKIEYSSFTIKVVTLHDMDDQNEYQFKPFRVSKRENNSSTIPMGRSGHRIVCNDTYLYLFGGYNPKLTTTDVNSSSLFKELWKLNLATGKWDLLKVKNLPTCLASNFIILIGDVLLVYGGSGIPFGANSSNKLYTCDLSSDELEFKQVEATGVNPTPGYGQSCFIDDDKFYVVGGTCGYMYWCDIDALDFRTSCWEAVYTCVGNNNEPEGRYRHELARVGDNIYILGGGTSNVSFGFKDLHVFSKKTKKWTLVPTTGDNKLETGFPQPRRFHSAVQLEHKVYIIGGMNQRRALWDTWCLNLDSLQWQFIKSLSLPHPTFFHDSTISPTGKIYTFGGVRTKDQHTDRTSDLYSSWICIPSLKEICWEAVLFYGLHKNDQLAKLIPTPFRKRLH